MREVVKIKSDKHPAGYYTQWRDAMKPGEVEYSESLAGTIAGELGPGIQFNPGIPAKPKRGRPKWKENR